MRADGASGQKTRVMIVDDHTLIRASLRALLGQFPDLEVVGEAGDGLEAVREAERLRPELVLMDVSMPRMGGLQATYEIARRLPNTRTLVLTMVNDDDSLAAALQAGARGYVLKDASYLELISAIRTVLDGGTYICSQLSGDPVEGSLGAAVGGGSPRGGGA